MNALRQAAPEYIAIRRSLGFKLRGHDRLLDDFIDHLEASGSTTITMVAALSWATSRSDVSVVRRSQRLSVVRGFASYVQCLDPDTEVPSKDLLPCRRERRAPYLYSDADISRLLGAAATLRPELRGATYAAYFGLLAVTGMRMGEAIGLDRAHVDLDGGLVMINDAKFRKHRRLPIHSSAVAALSQYSEIRDRLCPRPRVPAFFVSTRGTRLLDPCVHQTFNRLLGVIGLDPRPSGEHPRLHGLRHSFAVATVRDWYRQGADPTGRISVLSAYLGHSDPAYTYWYLQACPELLGLAAERLERWEGRSR
jgi:integrase/recombinase XerD